MYRSDRLSELPSLRQLPARGGVIGSANIWWRTLSVLLQSVAVLLLLVVASRPCLEPF